MATLTYVPKLYVCSCCGEYKPECDFYKQSYTGARTEQCKTCINVKRSVIRHKAKHGKFVSKEKCRGFGEEVDYELKDWQDAMVHFGGCCAFCGKPEGRSKTDKHDRDHLIAISKGGKTERKNVIPACRQCNRGRGNRDWLEWFKSQAFWSLERAKKIVAWYTQGGSNA